MEFYSLKKQLQEYAVRPAGSDRVSSFVEHLRGVFADYDAQPLEYRMPDTKSWSWGSLILFVLTGVLCMNREPLAAVMLVVLPSLMLLWEENGFSLWSKLFSLSKGLGLVLKKGDDPKLVLVANVDSRPMGLFDRWDPQGDRRTKLLNASLLCLCLLAFASFYFPWPYWQYATWVFSLVPLAVLVDLIYQGITKKYYAGALDNGSAALVLRMVSDLIALPHWIVLVDGGNVSAEGLASFLRTCNPNKETLFVALERPGAGRVAVAKRHGLWTAVTLAKEVKDRLQEAFIADVVDYSYRRSLAAWLSLRGYGALAVVGHLNRNESNLLLTDTVECIADKEVESAGATILRLVSLLEEPVYKNVD